MTATCARLANNMPVILMGFGDYLGYRLSELPETILSELAERYPLSVRDQVLPELNEMIYTVAVHGELKRRADGGKQEKHRVSVRDLGKSIVGKGFQQASKQH